MVRSHLKTGLVDLRFRTREGILDFQVDAGFPRNPYEIARDSLGRKGIGNPAAIGAGQKPERDRGAPELPGRLGYVDAFATRVDLLD